MKSLFCPAIPMVMLLGGCAQAPRTEIVSSGQWPLAAPASFGFGDLESGEDSALRTQIADCLRAKGMTAADKPAYLVQVGLSDRPKGAEVLLGNAAPSPHPAKRPSETLAFNLTSLATGKEAYRIRATQAYRQPAQRPSAATLADAACAAVGAPPAPAKPSS